MTAQYEREYDAWLTKVPEDTRKIVGYCDECHDDYLEGDEVWTKKTAYAGEDVDFHLCSIGCLAMFTAKYEIDIDKFEKAEAIAHG